MASTKAVVKESLRRPERQRSTVIADEPTKADIMDDIRIGLQQAAAGDGRPAHEAFKELRRKIAGDAHSR
ncbi:MAG: hypothetical protein OXG68_18725 [Chloroflexi bacterium]|nr:hypothetical protein [Chloroflexota bacterium]